VFKTTRGAVALQPEQHAVPRGDADRRRAAHGEAPDGVDHAFDVVHEEALLAERQERLLQEVHGARQAAALRARAGPEECQGFHALALTAAGNWPATSP
jgi:hypothetical protein